MPLIEIVSHCFAKRLRHYADALFYQLSSLVLWPPSCDVRYVLCMDPTDEATGSVVSRFASLDVHVIPLRIEDLGRRAIGRNIAALGTEADVVWFADVDQAFRGGILDAVMDYEWPPDVSMIYPRWIKIHRDHETGDRALAGARFCSDPLDVDESEFVDKRYKKAIGGVQIVRGDFARRHGYLRHMPRWLRPTDGRFRSCRCDVPYRKFCWEHGEVRGLDLPGLYRLRHTRAAHQGDDLCSSD